MLAPVAASCNRSGEKGDERKKNNKQIQEQSKAFHRWPKLPRHRQGCLLVVVQSRASDPLLGFKQKNRDEEQVAGAEKTKKAAPIAFAIRPIIYYIYRYILSNLLSICLIYFAKYVKQIPSNITNEPSYFYIISCNVFYFLHHALYNLKQTYHINKF